MSLSILLFVHNPQTNSSTHENIERKFLQNYIYSDVKGMGGSNFNYLQIKILLERDKVRVILEFNKFNLSEHLIAKKTPRLIVLGDEKEMIRQNE